MRAGQPSHLIDEPAEMRAAALVPMFVSNLPCRPAGRFHGPMVVTMRPIPEAQIQLVGELSARYPHAHGAPLHAGNPEAIGVADLGRPDYGDPVVILPGEVPVFWACGGDATSGRTRGTS
jgi:uncharacterized protein YcsI (UPF0317 family)